MVMKVAASTISPLLNNAYLQSRYAWPSFDSLEMKEFVSEVEKESGMRIKFEQAYDATGKFMYRLDSAEVYDQNLYMLFCIKYAG